MIDELNKAVQLAKSDLQAATRQLTELEKQVGSDLSELRSLLDSNSSDTSLRRTVSEIENELRQFRAAEKANQQLLALLTEAQADPTRLIAAPNRLLDSQPALRRLKEGLVDAQLRTAALQGRMSAEHPEVISAKEAEAQVAARMQAELSTAVRGLESELTVDASRLEMLEKQQNNASARLARLAGLRATYANLLGEATNRAKLLDRAEQNLTNARSDSASAKAASQIARVDAPDTGTNPVSPSAVDDRFGRRAGRSADGIRHRLAHRAGDNRVPAGFVCGCIAGHSGRGPRALCRAGGAECNSRGADRRAVEPDGRRSRQLELHPGAEGPERARQVQQLDALVASGVRRLAAAFQEGRPEATTSLRVLKSGSKRPHSKGSAAQFRTAAFIPAAKNRRMFGMGITAMWWNMPLAR